MGDQGPSPDPGESPAPPRGVPGPSGRGDGQTGSPPTDDAGSPGYSGDPNPQGGIGPDVPATAYDEAQDLRQQAAGQWHGAVGPEDIRVTYDESAGELVPELTASGRRELAARETGVDPEDIRLGEETVGTGTSPVGGGAPPGGGGTRTTVEFTQDVRRSMAREQLAGRIEGADASDIDVRQTESGGYEVATVFGEPPVGTETVETDGDAPSVTDEQFSGGAVGGQTTDPTYDPSAEQPAGIGEVAVDVAQRTVEDPTGYVGGGTSDFLTETEFVDVDASQRNEQVSVPGYERIRDPVQGAAQWWDENVGAATQRGAEYATGSETVGQDRKSVV